ncbi:TPA: hypothetical protein ACTXXA_000322 [Legionella anisa]
MLPFRIQVDQHTPGKMNVRYVPYAKLNPDYQDVAEKVTEGDLEISGWKVDEIDAQNLDGAYGTMRKLNTGGKQRTARPELVITEESGYDASEDELEYEYDVSTKKLGSSGQWS